MKFLKTTLMAVALVAMSNSVQAVVINTSDWIIEDSPSFSTKNLAPLIGGNQANLNGNRYGTLVSDFSLPGDFSFTGSMTPSGDNDIMGLVFGYQDESNHYRLGWEAGGLNDRSGTSGMFLVKEVAGVSSTIWQKETNWTSGTKYDFEIHRGGGSIGFSLGGNLQSFLDTEFLTGKIGVYTESQTANFTNLAVSVSAVPEPSTIALMAGGLGLVGFMAARRRKQA